MAEGRSNRAIADATWWSRERAVEKHVTSIFSKLDLPPATTTTAACSRFVPFCGPEGTILRPLCAATARCYLVETPRGGAVR